MYNCLLIFLNMCVIIVSVIIIIIIIKISVVADERCMLLGLKFMVTKNTLTQVLC